LTRSSSTGLISGVFVKTGKRILRRIFPLSNAFSKKRPRFLSSSLNLKEKIFAYFCQPLTASLLNTKSGTLSNSAFGFKVND